MLADFDVDPLTVEANEQSVDDIPEFSIDEIDASDISPNESEIKAATDIDIGSDPAQYFDDDSTNLSKFSSGSEPKMEQHPQRSMLQEESEEMDDWFADTVQHANDPTESAIDQPLHVQPKEEQSVPKWVWVASATVAGGAWSATQTRQVPVPSVHIDENQTKSDTINNFVPTVKQWLRNPL